MATIQDPSSLVIRNGDFSSFMSSGNAGDVQPNEIALENRSSEAKYIHKEIWIVDMKIIYHDLNQYKLK